MAKKKFYESANEFVSGEVPTAATWNERVFTLAQTEYEKRDSYVTGFFSAPTVAIDGANDKVDCSALDAILDGVRLVTAGSWAFVAQSSNTYYLQIDNTNAYSAATVEDTAKLTVATVAWDLATTTLSALTDLYTAQLLGSLQHTHGNKATLDTYNQTNANITDAVSKKHAHVSSLADIEDAVGKRHTELHDTEDHTALAENSASHSGLNYAYKAGVIRNDNAIVNVAASTVALTDDATNYIEVQTNGTVSANTSSFTAGRIPMATAVTAAGAITTVTDKRTWLTFGTAGGGSGDVVGPGSAVDSRLAVFDGVSGKLIKDSGVALAGVSTAVSHVSNTSNPHSVTYTQAGAEQAGAVATHEAAYDHSEIGNATTIQGQDVNAAVPSVGQVLQFDGAEYVPSTLDSSDVGLGNVTNDAQLKRAAGDFASFSEKANPINTDLVLIEDAADGGAKKKAQLQNLPIVSHDHNGSYFTESELGSTTDESAGADLIGVTTISGVTGNTVQHALESLAGSVGAATTSATGTAELATAAETTAGTDTARVITPDGLAGSDFGKRIVYLKVIAEDTALTTGDGKAYFTVPTELTGYNLVDADAAVYTVSSSGTPTVQIHNLTDTNDMLTTRITIDENEYSSYTAAAAPAIDGTKDDVVTGDRIRVDVDVAGTGTKGLDVILTFQLP